MKGHIGILRPKFFEATFEEGIYGMLDPTDIEDEGEADGRSLNRKYSIISSLLATDPGDLFFIYERGKKNIHGIFRIISPPFEDRNSELYEDEDDWPFRFRFEPVISLDEHLDFLELIPYMDEGKLWNFRNPSFLDPTGPRKSLSPLTSSETSILLNLLCEKNNIDVPEIDSIQGSEIPSDTSQIDIKYASSGGTLKAEYVLYSEFIKQMKDENSEIYEIIGGQDFVIPEAPISHSHSHVIDIMCIKRVSGDMGRYIFEKSKEYTLVECKTGELTLSDYEDQLLPYVELIRNTKSECRSVRPILIGNSVSTNLEETVMEAGNNKLQIITYSLDDSDIFFNLIE